MQKPTIVLLIFCIVGGIFVLASYIFTIMHFPKDINSFWGAIPKSFLPPYYLSMALAAIGYFIFTSFILLNISPEKTNGYSLYTILYICILIPSALWMPLVYTYLNTPSTVIWIFIRSVLVIVGLASLGIFILLITTQPKPTGTHYTLALASTAFFFFHTGILDALVWPYYFKR